MLVCKFLCVSIHAFEHVAFCIFFKPFIRLGGFVVCGCVFAIIMYVCVVMYLCVCSHVCVCDYVYLSVFTCVCVVMCICDVHMCV